MTKLLITALTTLTILITSTSFSMQQQIIPFHVVENPVITLKDKGGPARQAQSVLLLMQDGISVNLDIKHLTMLKKPRGFTADIEAEKQAIVAIPYSSKHMSTFIMHIFLFESPQHVSKCMQQESLEENIECLHIAHYLGVDAPILSCYEAEIAHKLILQTNINRFFDSPTLLTTLDHINYTLQLQITEQLKHQAPQWVKEMVVTPVDDVTQGELHPIRYGDKQIAFNAGSNTPLVIKADTNKCLFSLLGHTNGITSATFSPDSKLIATTSTDKTARIWETTTGKCLRILHGHMEAVNNVDFSFDGKHIATASDDGTARIWETETGTCLHVLQEHTNWVNHAKFTPTAEGSHNLTVVTTSCDGTSHTWDNLLESSAPVSQVNPQPPVLKQILFLLACDHVKETGQFIELKPHTQDILNSFEEDEKRTIISHLGHSFSQQPVPQKHGAGPA